MSTPYVLSERQLTIMMHLCNGLSQEEISEQMYLSVSGIQQQIARMRRKLGARNNVHLASIVIASGLLYYEDGTEQGTVADARSASNHDAPQQSS
jgi:DNA-binding CsgD family transcriptional regulator